MAQKLPFLKVNKTNIVDESGRPVRLKGVNLGGWLMMEGYMLCGRNFAEKEFRASFERALGRDGLEDFTRSFRDTFIQEDDIRTIKGWGANCIRIPFNYRLIEFEDKPFSFNEEGLGYLDRAVEWCEEAGIYCILDMHAAPGAQNTGWHSDVSGRPEFFASDVNKDRYLRLWHFLADRYKDSSAVAGYDVLNEPLVSVFEEKTVLKDVYDKVTREIRDADKKHIIFLEGNYWAQRIKFLDKPEDRNTVYSVHTYAPLDFTHNFVPGMRYPGKAYGMMWNKDVFKMLGCSFHNYMEEIETPLYMGEFGVNARDGLYGEIDWVGDLLDIFKELNISWTYWTYKTVANYAYPDGVYRYLPNPAWVNRQGPVMGWETYASLWPKEKGRMISSWHTENFTLNEGLFKVLKKHFSEKK